MDGGDQRCRTEAVESQRQPIQLVVNQIELGGSPEGVGNVQCLPHPSVHVGIACIAVRTDTVQLGSGD